jgi:hypothetical protein
LIEEVYVCTFEIGYRNDTRPKASTRIIVVDGAVGC